MALSWVSKSTALLSQPSHYQTISSKDRISLNGKPWKCQLRQEVCRAKNQTVFSLEPRAGPSQLVQKQSLETGDDQERSSHCLYFLPTPQH